LGPEKKRGGGEKDAPKRSLPIRRKGKGGSTARPHAAGETNSGRQRNAASLPPGRKEENKRRRRSKKDPRRSPCCRVAVPGKADGAKGKEKK